jgi:hypothetical protein
MGSPRTRVATEGQSAGAPNARNLRSGRFRRRPLHAPVPRSRAPRRGSGGVRPIVALFCIFATIVLLWGCGPGSSGGQPSAAPGQKEAAEAERIPGNARLVCARAGTRLLTPRVKARPDGVHFVIDNRFGGEAGYSFEFPEGEGGGTAPRGARASTSGTFRRGRSGSAARRPPWTASVATTRT